tara:strand:- start:40 stop:573 length:534 start_codon:yes stop_codon:yes gene_type:complete
MELKEQIRGELVKQKEEKLQKEKEINSKLTEVTLYMVPDMPNQKNPMTSNLRQYLTDNGVKYNEKDITIHPEIKSIVQIPAQVVGVVNGNYIVHGRDFQNPQQLVGQLRFLASPDYVAPSNSDEVLTQSIKNLNHTIRTQFQNLMRTLQPMLKVMNDLSKEMEAEKKETKIVDKKGA